MKDQTVSFYIEKDTGKLLYSAITNDKPKDNKVDDNTIITTKKPPSTKPYERLLFKNNKWSKITSIEDKERYIKSSQVRYYKKLQNIFSSHIRLLKKIAIEKPYMVGEAVDAQYETYEQMYRQALKNPDEEVNQAIIQKHETQAGLVHPYIIQVNNKRSEIEGMINSLSESNIDIQPDLIQNELDSYRNLLVDLGVEGTS